MLRTGDLTLSPEDGEPFLEWGSSREEEIPSRRRELCGLN